jgi:hypothetical protein
MPPADWWKTIHERIAGGDPTATAELAENTLDLLCTHLKCKFPALHDQDYIDDAAVEALMSYMKRPGQYDPHQRGLRGFLEMAAEGDLRNILAKEQRRKKRDRRESRVEIGEIAGKEPSGEGMTEDGEADAVTRTVAELFPDPVDQQLAVLVIDRERSTEKFAAILGIAHLPASEQQSIVKRHKDRIKGTLQRRGRNHHE